MHCNFHSVDVWASEAFEVELSRKQREELERQPNVDRPICGTPPQQNEEILTEGLRQPPWIVWPFGFIRS